MAFIVLLQSQLPDKDRPQIGGFQAHYSELTSEPGAAKEAAAAFGLTDASAKMFVVDAAAVVTVGVEAETQFTAARE